VAEEIASRAPGAAKTVTNSVVKKFPETSHAKVIEYRIRDRETLGKLFDHLLKRFQGRSSDDTFEVLN
jgi:ribosomal protein L17